MVTDPIADLLTRIRNGRTARHEIRRGTCRTSKQKSSKWRAFWLSAGFFEPRTSKSPASSAQGFKSS